MTELERIAAALDAPPAGGVPVLATLMSVAGSAYRGPGARMVIHPDDTVTGALSGGCLEKDITAHAAAIRGSGVPAVVRYDLTQGDDLPWGLGMGCNAKLDVLLEPCPGGAPGWLRETLAALAARQPVVIGTIYGGSGGSEIATTGIGDRVILIGNDAPVHGAPAQGPLAERVKRDAHRVMDEERSDVVAEDGTAILYEFLPRPIRLVICGEGADTAPLARLGAELGWRVDLVGKQDALPVADGRTAAVVMTHNYPRDLALLRELLPGRARYTGVLGPRARTERLLAELEQGGLRISALDREQLYAPVGLDLGAETPEEVALSVAAEIRAVMAGRRGGMLRERRGPIHERR